ncbi:hypothetical protein BDQ17DRAFT_1263914 [Cyathus striatus]|nr:hypothetical protein BDQ17DRAFT_1263914 [Cyathus striatus]
MLAHLTRLFYLFSVLSIARAVLVNVTVDDASPDPLTGKTIAYLPTASWQQGDSCTTCNAGADGRLMNGGTWHDGTVSIFLSPSGPLNATFVFNGTAIYVFCALALQTTNALAAFSNMTFYIDGDLVGQFQRIPPGTNGFQYNVSVYSNTTLSPGSHTFMLQNGVAVGNGGDTSLTLFDYLVYS